MADVPTGAMEAGNFLRTLIAAVPYTVHTVRTDNGTHFTTPGNTSSAAPLIKEAIEQGEIFRAHSFELACAQNDIDHRLTKPRHPWTNGPPGQLSNCIQLRPPAQDPARPHLL